MTCDHHWRLITGVEAGTCSLEDEDGAEIEPVYRDDNYFELMPGETRLIDASYPQKLLGGAASYIQVDGWNVVSAPAK